MATHLGLEVHAGHGLTYDKVGPVAAIPEPGELNIGHFLIGEAIFGGLDSAIRRMRALMDEARAESAASAAHDPGRAMILGIGSDLIDIRRIEETLERFGDRFIERIFTEIERRKSDAPRQPRRQLRQALRRQGGLRQGAGHRLSRRRVLARHGRGQSAGRQADHEADRRRAGAAGRDHAARACARRSTFRSPTTFPRPRPSSSFPRCRKREVAARP